MSVQNDLKRNDSLEIVPQGFSSELNDWKEVVVNEDGEQKIAELGTLATEAKLEEINQRIQVLEGTVEGGLQKVALNGNIGKPIRETIILTGGTNGEPGPWVAVIVLKNLLTKKIGIGARSVPMDGFECGVRDLGENNNIIFDEKILFEGSSIATHIYERPTMGTRIRFRNLGETDEEITVEVIPIS